MWKTGGPVFPPKRVLVAQRASDSKKKCRLSAVATPNREKAKKRRTCLMLQNFDLTQNV